MEVEVVRFNKMSIGSMETILVKKFYNTEDANKFYQNWECLENNDKDFFITGEDWNNTDKINPNIPDDYKYKYTYTVNLWDLIFNEIIHSHNFTIFIKKH